jgi:hypothetical protein
LRAFLKSPFKAHFAPGFLNPILCGLLKAHFSPALLKPIFAGFFLKRLFLKSLVKIEMA